MMSDPTTVDRTTADELTGRPVLVIDEDREWRETGPMHRQLTAKVRHYVRHSRSHEFKNEYGQLHRSAIVRLVTDEPPGEESLRFFARVAYELSKNDLSFEHQLGEHGIPVTIAPSAEELPEDEPLRMPFVPPAPAPSAPPGSSADAGAPPEPAAVEEPATEELVTPEPFAETVEEPVFEEPLVEEPAAEELESAPLVEEPAAEEPLAEPLFEELAAEEPVAEPLAEEPAPAAPIDEPVEELVGEVAADQPPVEATHDSPVPTFLDLEFDTEGLEEKETGTSESPLFEEELPPTGEMPVFEEASDLERLVGGAEFLDLDEPAAAEPVEPTAAEPPSTAEPSDAPEPAAVSKEAKPSYPPFFPEEEFGRAIPDMDDVAAVFEMGHEPAILESGTGKRFVLDTTSRESAAKTSVPAEGRPNLRAAIAAAASAAIAGAIGWALLAIPAGGGASPVSVALALMVGMNVRVRGAGRTRRFRIVGVVGTVLGSLLGGFLAALTLTLAGVGFDEIAGDHAAGLTGLISMLTSPGALLAAIDRYFEVYDLAFVALAAYIAFKLSASKSSA